MTSTTQLGFTQQSFDSFIASRDEPGWCIDLRKQAWQTFTELAPPSRTEEEWIRTDIRLFKWDRFGMPGEDAIDADSKSAAPVSSVLSDGVELGGSAYATNGIPQQNRLDAKWADQGVLFGSLEQMVKQHGDLIKRYLFDRAVNPNYDKFAALHAACWTGGSFLYVPRGVCIAQPIHSLSSLTSGGSDFGHTLVILEDGAEATFLYENFSPDPEDTGFFCGATEVIVGKQANLRYVGLQDLGHGVWNFAHQKAIVDADSTMQWTVGALGSRLSKVNQRVALVGPGASCQVNGVMFTEGKQHLSYHTLQHHEAPSCRSDFLYKAALQDKSRTVWRGMIKVDPDAQKTDGYQRNDNLLLSSQARADAIPGLEIEADDVRCTHGSTTGRVDDELIFYAQSRGFTRKEAIRLIVTGFFQQVFDRITIDSVREALGRAIARRVREYE